MQKKRAAQIDSSHRNRLQQDRKGYGRRNLRETEEDDEEYDSDYTPEEVDQDEGEEEEVYE